MKSDINGCSVCDKGQESYEYYTSSLIKKDGSHIKLLQYDYRTIDGKLFSCIAKSLTKARLLKNKWLSKNTNVCE